MSTISELKSKKPAPASAAIIIEPMLPLPEYSKTRKQMQTFCTRIKAVSPKLLKGNWLRTL